MADTEGDGWGWGRGGVLPMKFSYAELSKQSIRSDDLIHAHASCRLINGAGLAMGRSGVYQLKHLEQRTP